MSTTHAQSEVGHYELLRLIGEGGFSTVYEAVDKNSGERVALKQLSRAGPSALTRFKQEFRAVQGLHHPNIVELRELLDVDGTWYIAMELLEGKDLVEHLRHGHAAAFDTSEVHRTFSQLTDALCALHARGVIHRDLKPRNVLVTPSGRVVLLDFGLAELVREQRGNTAAGIGTAEYMAPEQIDGGAVQAAADFYALGVCLYEVLAGRTPFSGLKSGEILQRKLRQMPPSPSTHNPAVSAKLASLCMHLLEIDPQRRPTGDAISRVLNPRASAGFAMRMGASEDDFTGRKSELQELGKAFARSRAGEFALILVEGESGMGKSSLVTEFIHRIEREQGDALVLHARCYENERSAYKAFDGGMAQLAQALDQLPPESSATLLPPRAVLLPRLFPALGGVSSIAHAASSGLPADPAAQRVAAVQALLALLANVSKRYHLVLEIDDLQWADADSFRLLHMLAEAPQRPSLLIVATARAVHEISEQSAHQLALVRQLRGVHSLLIHGLSRPDAGSLAARLLGEQASEHVIDSLVAESRGHPMFLAELVTFLKQHTGDISLRKVTLSMVLRSRIEALAPQALRLVVAAAVAGRPYPPSVLGRALDLDEHELGRLLTELLAAKLLRRRHGHDLECFHDRIREVAQTIPSEDAKRALHKALAASIARQPSPDLGEVARHQDAAGETMAAIATYARSAEQALTTLAFARAEQLAGRALQIAGGAGAALPVETLHALELTRAHALAGAGRSKDAAAQYLAASQSAQGEARLRLRILHARHLLQSAQRTEGQAAARALLAELDIPLPTSSAGMHARAWWERTMTRFTRPGRTNPAADARGRLKLDALWSVLGWFDVPAQRVLIARYGRLARALRDPESMVRALTEDAYAMAAKRPYSPEVDRVLRSARAQCDALGNPTLDVIVAWREAVIASLRWSQLRQQERLEHALRVATEHCADDPWLMTLLRTQLGTCWDLSAAHATLARATADWVLEARERNDVYAQCLILGTGCGFLRQVMAGDCDHARAELEAALRPLLDHPFAWAHWGASSSILQIELCRGGDGALRALKEIEDRAAGAEILRSALVQSRLPMLRANAALAACRGASADDKARLLAQTSECQRQLHKRGQHPEAVRLRAQLSAIAGNTDTAFAEIKQARAMIERAALPMVERPLEYMEGLFQGGAEGALKCQRALAFFAEQGWKDPRSAVARICPALHVVDP